MASDGARKQFWKRSNSKVPGSIQHVYGAQHPPFDPLLHGTLLKSMPKVPTTPVKAKRVSTFQEFESNTSDAWDAGEDDDELLAMAAESLNTEVVMETAHRVLRNHSQRQGQHTLQEAPGPEQRPSPVAEPLSAPGGDLRLVKSVSESHTSCPAESTSDAVPLQRSQSLPHSATVTLGVTSDLSTLSSSALSEREASRLDKFRQLLAGPNTDLGKCPAARKT
ncbi:PREDICTED: TBC1 domain family member 22A-like [Galeopterus variegatus]|uniref:TBC1 domain family member 22A-like n=1 Tax=Galeopterus variegatus TaxID=482537 RepID=A0ABM0S748_GALVR|nr:PREDICTED: TBC1 domain family member 22A-like [Galeopterus variegatus]